METASADRDYMAPPDEHDGDHFVTDQVKKYLHLMSVMRAAPLVPFA